MLVLLALKLAGTLLLVERGFEASYYTNDHWAPPVERSTDFRSRAFTRIDRRLAFGVPGAPVFPLYFLNDVDRETPPLSVTWEGDIWASADEGSRNLFLRGKDVAAELWVDGVRIVDIKPPSGDAFWPAPWPKGRHRVVVRLSSPTGAMSEFEAGFVDPGTGDKIPFREGEIVARSYPAWRLAADRIFRPLATVIDGLLLVVLVACAAVTLLRELGALWGSERRKASAALAWLAAGIAGLVLASKGDY